MANEIHPVTLAEALGPRALNLAAKLAKEGLDGACLPVPIPTLPYGCVEANAEWLKDMRAKGHDDQNGMVATYTAWETAKAGAIHENENRLRGLLWCYRALRSAYVLDKEDTELAFLGQRVRAFLARHWGIDEPPTERLDCNEVAMLVVATRVRA